MRFVNPVVELGSLLLEVEKPARYTGGEYGILCKKDAVLKTLIAFPDLYEIGMGNQALRIIYNHLNKMEDVSCDRAFAPAPDFEKLLREKNIPVYGLDTGISLADLDLLMFTLGYELGLNGILTILDVSGIPLRSSERETGIFPLVIAGGSAVSNPLPFSPFIDAFWIGEAEAGFFELAGELASLKKSGYGRDVLFEKIALHPNMWVKGKQKTKRAIAAGFNEEPAVFPVPGMKTVQHHGTVEIMRGCPNGCRFCHAGFWYRPMRQKSETLICNQAIAMVKQGGWREISLSSLSSGDYNGVGELVEKLNRIFVDNYISFQMPSLRVSGFSLDLLEHISRIRKSGLTFAVETARDAWQMAINKEVTRDMVISILGEAKKRGWKSSKFYFMIGLPVSQDMNEEEEIVNFVKDVGKRTRMNFTVNVGIFVPKPHTPYQWMKQIDSESAREKLDFIIAKLKPFGHKVSVSDPVISKIEGLLSRGDEQAGLLCEKAFLSGSRLDPWREYIKKDTWIELLETNSKMINNFLVPDFPWKVIDSCVSQNYLKNELYKSNKCERSVPCDINCKSLCGVCGLKNTVVKNQSNTLPGNKNQNDVNRNNYQVNKQTRDPSIYRLLFCFSKKGGAVFHGHLSLIEIFSMAFTRSEIPVIYTQGFNPIAKIEFASPLACGITSLHEIACVDFSTDNSISAENFIERVNRSIHDGIQIEQAEGFYIAGGMKKHSLSSLLWGFAYNSESDIDFVKAAEDKQYKEKRCGKKSDMFHLQKLKVLAKNITGSGAEYISYFEAYRYLYNGRQKIDYEQ